MIAFAIGLYLLAGCELLLALRRHAGKLPLGQACLAYPLTVAFWPVLILSDVLELAFDALLRARKRIPR